MPSSGDPVVFTSTSTRAGRASRCTVVLAGLVWLLVVMAKNVTPLVELYMGIVAAGAVVAIVGIVRAARIAITLDERGVTVRTTFATRSWHWDEIRTARSLDRASRGGPLGLFSGFSGISAPREPHVQVTPSITLASGTVVRLVALRMTLRSQMDSTWVDEALVAIARRAEERRGGDPPTGSARRVRPS